MILAEDDSDVHHMLRKLKDAYKEWGLTINTSNTEYMKIGEEGQDSDFENEVIRNSMWYKGLDVRLKLMVGQNK